MSAARKNSHCSYCGAAFADGQPWPRTCAACGQTSFVNPLPVAVVLVPVENGLLGVRRAIPPKVGEVALPGGFINIGETWQAAGAREVFEETGVTLDPASIRDFRTLSAPDGTLLVFGLAPPIAGAAPKLVANEEVSELVVIPGPEELAFSLHTQAVAEYFARR
jgi:ADP-ribose pyrophosphatase YjhB (NUDIX family)